MIDLNGQSLGAIALPFLGGFAGSAMMQKNMDQFYPVLFLLSINSPVKINCKFLIFRGTRSLVEILLYKKFI